MSLPPETPLTQLRRMTRPEPRCCDEHGHEGNALAGIFRGVLIGAAMWWAGYKVVWAIIWAVRKWFF